MHLLLESIGINLISPALWSSFSASTCSELRDFLSVPQETI